MKIRRFFSELKNPKLKCERLGHDIETREVEIMRRWTRLSNGVATMFDAEIDRCKRCRLELEPRNEVETKTLNGISMPEEMARKLDRKGWIEW